MYQDDLVAAHARIHALQQENTRLQETERRTVIVLEPIPVLRSRARFYVLLGLIAGLCTGGIVCFRLGMSAAMTEPSGMLNAEEREATLIRDLALCTLRLPPARPVCNADRDGEIWEDSSKPVFSDRYSMCEKSWLNEETFEWVPLKFRLQGKYSLTCPDFAKIFLEDANACHQWNRYWEKSGQVWSISSPLLDEQSITRVSDYLSP